MSKRATLIVGFVIVLFAVVPLALAGTKSGSVVAGYGGNGGNVLAQVKQAPKGGGLPYTGLDLLLFAAGGAALVGVGVAARAAGRKRSS
jgi:hypothetical protein